MTEAQWKRSHGVLGSWAAKARSEGREPDALAYDVLAELGKAVHSLESRVASVEDSLRRLTRKVLDLESRVHEDVEG